MICPFFSPKTNEMKLAILIKAKFEERFIYNNTCFARQLHQPTFIYPLLNLLLGDTAS